MISYGPWRFRLKFTDSCFKHSCKGDAHEGVERVETQAMENETPPDAEEGKLQAKREKGRARAAAYRRANAEKLNAEARARRATMSDAQRLAISQKQKKWRNENREKYRDSVARTNAKRRAKSEPD
jgi:hypothetical protein